MKCPRCQHENEAGAKFCEECATPVARVCAQCGRPLSPTAKFCPECAHPTGLSATPPAAQGFDSPETYTPKHLAERILTSKSALEGERKQVTVLFADLKGSMELLAHRDPEEARKLLDPVLERMMEAVHRYEGTVNQVMGDGIMALFGAPLSHEDHAVRACYAALRMQDSVKRYAEGVRREEGVTIRIRVGLNSGEVVVRAIGSDLHMDYTAVGQTTHLAARMEQLADPGSALLTAAVLVLAEDFVQVKSLGAMAVKGMSDRIDVYELLGATPVRSRFQAHASRGLTKFVGRTNEVAQLTDALDLAKGGRGQVVAVVGEPGVGKSRLFWEFAHSHRVDGCLVIEAASVSYGRATTYLPVIGLLRGYFQIEARDDTRKIREKVTGKLLSLDRALEPVVPPLFALLDVPVEDGQWTRLEPAQRRQRTLDAVKRLLLRESQIQPLVVAFEDLHWIDGETQAVLESFIESLPTARVLLLVNYRPEYQHGWGSKTYYRQLRIDMLPAASAEELLEALLGTDVSLEPLKGLLIARTEGNPFFLEESVRTLVEAKALVGERRAYRLTGQLEGIQVPPTVQAVLATRIDRLPPEEKSLLQTASVIGKDIPFVLLKAMRDEPEDDLRRSLAHLQAAEFLYETRLFPDPEYTFKHALTYQVAYESLLGQRRRALHAGIVTAIEQHYPDRLAEHVERLAYHAFRGERWDRAVRYAHEAGIKVYARSAAAEAMTHFEQAMAALRHLPETRAALEQAIDLRVALRDPLAQLVEYQRTLEHLREAERVATAIGDESRLGRVLALLAFSLYQAGQYEEANRYGERALTLAAKRREPHIETPANFYIAQAHYLQGRYREAMTFYDRAFSASGWPSPGRLTRPAAIRTWSAVCLAEMGQFDEAVGRSNEALEIAEAMDEPFSVVAAHFGAGTVRLERGDLAPAIRLLERGLDLCRTSQVAMYHHRLLAALGYAYGLVGRAPEGIALLQKVGEIQRSRGAVAALPRTLAWQGEVLLLAGEREKAQRVAHEALTVARAQGERGGEAWALYVQGGVASGADLRRDEEAVSYFQKALALATDLGMLPLVAHGHLGLGKLYRRPDERDERLQHLRTATMMYADMGMRFWLEKADLTEWA